MKPFRAETSFCFVAADIDAAGELIERVDEALKALGAYPQGGSCGLMDRADVIENSPLDEALKTGAPAPGAGPRGPGPANPSEGEL